MENEEQQPDEQGLLCLRELDRLIETKKGMSRRKMSLLLGLGPTTAQKWFEKGLWSYRDEERISALFGKPRTYFEEVRERGGGAEEKPDNAGAKQQEPPHVNSPFEYDTQVRQAAIDQALQRVQEDVRVLVELMTPGEQSERTQPVTTSKGGIPKKPKRRTS